MPKIFKNATTAVATGVATSATLLATSTMPLPSAHQAGRRTQKTQLIPVGYSLAPW
jgi:hypothetical protein